MMCLHNDMFCLYLCVHDCKHDEVVFLSVRWSVLFLIARVLSVYALVRPRLSVCCGDCSNDRDEEGFFRENKTR